MKIFSRTPCKKDCLDIENSTDAKTHFQSCSLSELILYDQALVIGPKIGNQYQCLNCMKTLPKDHAYQCSKCKWPLCDLDCEKGKSHQRECATLASHPKVGKIGTTLQYFHIVQNMTYAQEHSFSI